MNRRHGVQRPEAARVAFVLDDAWPEYASMVAAMRAPGDQLVAPGLFGRPVLARYGWPGPADHRGPLATARRHLAMRRVARAPGGIRQRAYLEADRRLARALGRAIDYRADHLVVAQAWLPWLDVLGLLGGRTFDVVMSRYPMESIHRMLDRVAAEPDAGPSATIADFRAPPALVARESALLARARRIITPHHGIAALFPGRALPLAWHRPAPVGRAPGSRVAFLGPMLTRQRPHRVRALAAALPEPLILFTPPTPASAAFWGALPVEHRAFGPGWMDGLGAILHPAAFTHQPRRLLEARVNGIAVLAGPESGLSPDDYRPIERLADGMAQSDHMPNRP